MAKKKSQKSAKARAQVENETRRRMAEAKVVEPSQRLEELVAQGVVGPLEPDTQQKEASIKVSTPAVRRMRGEGQPKTPARDDAPQPPDDSQEIVVFAFRLTRAERDLIHAAAGSAKASRFVRAIVLADARGDMKEVQEVVDEIHATRQ